MMLEVKMGPNAGEKWDQTYSIKISEALYQYQAAIAEGEVVPIAMTMPKQMRRFN